MSQERRPVQSPPGRDETTHALQPAASTGTVLPVGSILVTVVAGPQAGAVVRVEGDHLRIGASSDNDLVLADSTVSRQHALLVQAAEGILVRDLGSRNGTFLDGNRIREAFVGPGSRLRCGGTEIELRLEREDLRIPAANRERFGELWGASPKMQQLFGIMERVAPTELNVLILGETGTGKDLVARAIHEASARAAGPMGVLDGAALEPSLVSVELFGNEQGAYTGADRARPGAFERARGGTLFLDEVGEIPLELQPRLLRVLERREVRRLGGEATIPVDCRVVAATHRDLPQRVAAGAFREDLYHRLAQVVMKVPPLRERAGDASRLAARWLAEEGRELTPAARRLLDHDPFPGNVRELRNLLRAAAMLGDGGRIGVGELEAVLAERRGGGAGPRRPASGAPGARLEDHEKAAIEAALAANGFHRGRTARQLGISEPTLREKIRRYGIAASRSGRARGEEP